MGGPPVGATLTRTASIALAVAAGLVLLLTALANCEGKPQPGAAPSRPATPVPTSTVPGSVPLPAETPTRASATASGLRALAGRWVAAADARSNYFVFQADGSGEWVAYGQRVWTGTAMPRSTTTFELSPSESDDQSESYWRVRLTDGGTKLFFEGDRQTYHRA